MIHIREITMLFLSPTFICFTSSYSSVQRCSKANCLRDIKPWYYYVTLPQILLHFSILSSPIHAIVQTPIDDNVNLLCSVGHSYFDLLHVKDSSIAISAQNIAGKKGDWQKITSATWSLVGRGIWPLGKPVATAATGMSSALYLDQIYASNFEHVFWG